MVGSLPHHEQRKRPRRWSRRRLELAARAQNEDRYDKVEGGREEQRCQNACGRRARRILLLHLPGNFCQLLQQERQTWVC